MGNDSLLERAAHGVRLCERRKRVDFSVVPLTACAALFCNWLVPRMKKVSGKAKATGGGLDKQVLLVSLFGEETVEETP